MARAIALNAKMRRTGVCGAAETLLCDRAGAAEPPAARGDRRPDRRRLRGARRRTGRGRSNARVVPATDADWATEYLDAILSVKLVDGLDDAVAHIARWGSHHTDSIVTEDAGAAEAFLERSRHAICLWNASTQFADGGEFGMGAEIGISTGRLHVRRPGRGGGTDHLQVRRPRVPARDPAGSDGGSFRGFATIAPRSSSRGRSGPSQGRLYAGCTVGLLGGLVQPGACRAPAHFHAGDCPAGARLGCGGFFLVFWSSPQNPLKAGDEMAPLDIRLKIAREVADHPRIVPTAIERDSRHPLYPPTRWRR